MPATGTDLGAQFARDGFVVVTDLFSAAECAEWKAECQRILEAVRAERRAGPGEVADDRSLFPGGVYVGLAMRSPLFHQAAADGRVVTVLSAILAPNVEFLSDKVVFKDGHEDIASPWHQDYPYWRGGHKVSVWIALDAATPENGCLRLLPGSHRAEVRHDHVESRHGFGTRVERLDESTAVSAPLPAGGAVFFHDLTLHASHPNRSGADRWAVITTYRDAREVEPETMRWPAARVVVGTGPAKP